MFLTLRPRFEFAPIEKIWTGKIVEPTEAQKKRDRFGTMFMLHALLNRAGVDHENKHTLICSGYVKTKDRF